MDYLVYQVTGWEENGDASELEFLGSFTMEGVDRDALATFLNEDGPFSEEIRGEDLTLKPIPGGFGYAVLGQTEEEPSQDPGATAILLKVMPGMEE